MKSNFFHFSFTHPGRAFSETYNPHRCLRILRGGSPVSGGGGLEIEPRPRPLARPEGRTPAIRAQRAQARKERMKTTQIPNLVSYLLGLFDTLVLLVAWPSGKKGCKGVDFTKVTLKDMADPEYRQKLAQGNIGVVQGEASGGIASIDIDDDAGAEEFLALNPDLKETLRTRGARGCNVWFYPEGDRVPASCRLKREGKPWGEWRFNGCQTIIAGVHPSGVPYTLLNATPAIHYPFDKVKFPAGVTARFIRSTNDSITLTPDQQTTDQQTTEPQSVVLCSPLCPSVHTNGGNGALDQETLETLLAGTIPTERHGNHERLFTLARRVKAFEMGRSTPLGEAELQAIFSLWYQRAAGFLRADQAWDEYYYEFTEAYGDVQRPGGDAVVDIAWRAISTTSGPLPPETELVVDARLKKLIALCHLLQALAGPNPFYLACRTVQRLFNLRTHETAATWLRILRKKKIVAEVTKGGPASMKATRYYYCNVTAAQGGTGL